MLIELASEEFARVGRFFGPAYPNLAFVYGVIEGRLPGRVWARQEGQGFSACLIATEAPFCFAAGALDRETLDAMLELLKKRQVFTFVYPPGLDIGEAAARHGLAEGERLQFGAKRGEDPGGAFETPSPFELARIDGELYQKSNWRDAVHGIFGPPSNFVENHYGFGLLLEGRLISEAHGVVGGGLVEFGAFTLAEYRRAGLSNVACAAVKSHGAKLGLRVVATCDAGKAASIAICRRIGLRDEFRYKVLRPPG